MRRFPVTVTAEFVFPLAIGDGKVAAELECCATCKVKPGEPARPWHDDPGCGPEILSDFTDIMIDCGGYSREAGCHVSDWVAPDADILTRIRVWLLDGNADEQFGELAEDRGTGMDPDYRRELLRESL